MKKLLLSFLSFMGWGFSVFAQSHINIELLSATYTTTPAMQFRVSWNAIPVVNGETHNSKIWLWVDFRKIENNQPSGTWTRATVANPSSGTLETGNDKGFWLQGNSGSYSQIVTVALTNITANTKFNWCAYGSDFPPNVTLDNGTYTFKGTTDFIVSSHAQPVTTNTIARTSLTVNSSSTFTDATGCPGIGQLYCPYTGSDLIMDATHLCQQRTTGAKNWEAYIKDSRDDKVYRIVQIETTWWFAEDFLLTGSSGTKTCGSETLYLLSTYVSCPSDWDLPTWSKWQTRLELDAGFPVSSIYGDEVLTRTYGVRSSEQCITNANYHVLAKDHTTGHCWFPGSLERGCNVNLRGSSRCIREL